MAEETGTKTVACACAGAWGQALAERACALPENRFRCAAARLAAGAQD
jgi:hypothetical protein